MKNKTSLLAGAALSLLGALGVSGFSEGAAFLIAWEAMSFGGAAMILSENQGSGRPVLFMLALLETGLILLLLAILVLGGLASGLDFGRFPSVAQDLSAHWRFALTMLLLLGFGAKLGLLPFYLVLFGTGNAVLLRVLSYVPFSAAMGMPVRIYLGDAAWWEPILSLVVLVATAGGVVALAALVYERSVLRMGARVRLGEVLGRRATA